MKRTNVKMIYKNAIGWAVVLVFVAACTQQQEILETTVMPDAKAIANGTISSDPRAVGAIVKAIAGTGYMGAICTGTLIDEHWVVTTASCVENNSLESTPRLTYFVVGQDASITENHTFFADVDILQIDRIKLHPGWDSANATENNVALLHLALSPSEAGITDVPALPVYTGNLSAAVGSSVTYYGYGSVDEDATSLGIKRSFITTIGSTEVAWFSSENEGAPFFDADSGSGAIVNGSVAGVMFAQTNSVPAAVVSTRLDTYSSWIDTVIGSVPDCNITAQSCSCDAACNTDGSCDNTVCEKTNCMDLYDCIAVCADQECVDACYVAGSEIARENYNALNQCSLSNCNPAPDGMEFLECLQTYCELELDTCVDLAPPCTITGGDCAPGFACYATASGDFACFPSDQLDIGTSCDATLSDTLPCDDGALCLPDETCHAFCIEDTHCDTDEYCAKPLWTDVDNVGACMMRPDDTDTNTDTMSDTSTETDTAIEVDTETLTDTDTGISVDTATDTATDTYADADADTDTDTATDMDTHADTGTDSDADGDSDTDTDTNADTDTATDMDTHADMGTDSDSDSDTEMNATIDSDTGAPGDSDTHDSDSDFDIDADISEGSDDGGCGCVLSTFSVRKTSLWQLL